MPTISKNNQNLFPSFFNELNNLFNDQWLSTSMQHSIPAINVSEDAKEYKIEIAAPSTTKEDFNLSVNNGILSIRMEKKCDNKEENNEKEEPKEEKKSTKIKKKKVKVKVKKKKKKE